MWACSAAMASRTKASLRWQLLRHFLLPKSDCPDNQELTGVSRRPHGYFGLVTFERINYCEVDEEEWQKKEPGCIIVKYHLPASPVVDLSIIQRKEDGACYSDFTYAKEHHIDMTGLVGLWPAEEVLTHFCVKNPSLFRNKRVLELGSGYGLGGLAIAACTEAAQMILTDGNPLLIEYIKASMMKNIKAFGDTEVKACLLHWSEHVPSMLEHSFDMVIAADCTFFSDSHFALASSVKRFLRKSCDSQALFFNPQRDGSLNAFLQTARGVNLNVEVREQYDASVWSIHQNLVQKETSGWCNYDTDHCYPLLAVLTHADTNNDAEALA